MGGPWAKQKRTSERVTANVIRARVADRRSYVGDDAMNSVTVFVVVAYARIHRS